MNILYLAHRIPFPPNKGDKIRSFRQLEHLARKHNVWCACFVDDEADMAHVDVLRAYCRQVEVVCLSRPRAYFRGVAGLLSGGTMTEAYLDSRRMRAVLVRMSREVSFDVAVAFSSGMAPYALDVPAKRRVLDLCDLDSQKWLDFASATSGPRKMLFETEGKRLAARELQWINSFDASILITQQEAADLGGPVAKDMLHIVGNGVQLQDAPPTSPMLKSDSSDETSQDRPSNEGSGWDMPTVGFVGVLDYRPNIDGVCWFVKSIWPLIRRVLPDAEFRIVGRSPTRTIYRLNRVAGVRVVGEVQDVGSELQRFDVSVAPLRLARGLQNKVLEAMAAALPVVLTTGAARGLGAEHGQDLLVADSPQPFADQVLELLASAPLRQRIGSSARHFVAVNHCWEAELQKFELIVTGVLGARRSRSVAGVTNVPDEPRALAHAESF